MHAAMAQKMGASWEEVKGCVALNLHLSGMASVLECFLWLKKDMNRNLVSEFPIMNDIKILLNFD